LIFFGSGCNFFGQSEDQNTNLLVIYFSFSLFLLNASDDLPQVSSQNIVDIVIYCGYFVSFYQFFTLLYSNIIVWDGTINGDITFDQLFNSNIGYSMPIYVRDYTNE